MSGKISAFRRYPFSQQLGLLTPALLLVCVAVLAAPVTADVAGNVFRDYNADGARAGAGEPGIDGAVVTVFNDAGDLCQVVTDAAGDYTVDTDTCDGGGPLGAGAASEFRVEFTLPGGGSLDFLEPGAAGGTTVQFVDVSGGDVTGVDAGLNAPADYCEADPPLATTCFVDANLPNDQALVTFLESEVSDMPGAAVNGVVQITPMTETAAAVQSEVGTVWGLAWQRSTESLFSAAFVKFQPALGTASLPDGPGAIYRTDLGGGGSSLFTTIASVGTHTGIRDEVGRVGLGDLEISHDGDTLYTVNLSTKELVTIPLLGNPPTPGTITTTALPVPPVAECAAADVHPFALGIHREKLYVGMTCGAPVANLRAWVYELDGGIFTQKINLPFTYGRASTNTNYQPPIVTNNLHTWSDWNTYDPVTAVPLTTVYNARSQPWLTDIAFDNGDMILGIRSRRLDTATNVFFVKGGDTLRACADSVTFPTVWTLENNGTCGGVTPPVMATDPWTNSPNVLANYLGPGGGEYYWNDDGWEGESTQGALVQIPGRAHLVVSQIDALGHINQQGVMRLDHTSGLITGAGNVFFGNNVNNIGKANGLGDIEALCAPAPLEIGNRVWCDANMDGVQDPGMSEAGVAGVDVVLDCGVDGTLTVTTDAAGQYLFRDADFQVVNGTPIPRDANCTISIDLASEGATISAACLGTSPAPVDAGANDLHDSDCTDLGGGLRGVDILTGMAGENNHTYDCGFFGIPADYGDAPETYGTMAGPSHELPPGATLYLGDCVDTEGSGQPVTAPAPANGDDLGAGLMTAGSCAVSNDDEDGVVFTTMVAACNMASVDVTCQGTGGRLSAWVDWSGDGTFGAGEQIFASTSLTCGGATESLAFAVPCTAASGLSYARFRVSTAGGSTPTDAATDGEVEDYEVTVKGVDYGDAPDSYGTTQGANGASHAVDPGSPLYLGACVDTESDGQPVAVGTPANGDDLGAGLSDLGGCAGPDDEDGVTFDTMVVTCENAQVTVTASQSGLLDAWIDFNGDGDFADAGEKIFTNQALAGGPNVLPFSVPCTAAAQAVTYTRFRFSTAGGLGPQGPAMDGEVEDHDVPLKGLDFGDAPGPYPTSLVDDGPRHSVPPTGNPTLGLLVDTEPDGQPNADHTGDDSAGADDEDGVVILGDLIPGIASNIDVNTGAVGGRLDGWCDWNGDGDWADAGEQIATSQVLPGGATTTLTPMVPAGATLGMTCCRFRLSTVGGLMPTGLAMDGEVEDYKVTIAPEDPLIGVAKELISVTEVTPGLSYAVLFKLTVENFGNVKLNNVQLTADLADAFSGAASFTVSLVGGMGLTVNPSFDGAGDQNLLDGTDMLGAWEMGMVDLEVLVEPGTNLGPYFCSSQATATSIAGTPVMDLSQTGASGDPDGNGDPTDNDQPTPVTFPTNIPTLGEWGLILLVLLLSAASFSLLKRRRGLG